MKSKNGRGVAWVGALDNGLAFLLIPAVVDVRCQRKYDTGFFFKEMAHVQDRDGAIANC